MGTHLNCHNICNYKEVDIKYTGCNLKTMELLDCALIGVCAVIRSNTVLNGKQCRSRIVGFLRNQLICIYTVCKVYIQG